ncbi:hypothetical protein PVAP13_1KG384605 [Panicum virgatum]|uniref:Uncharacterized protein n=1 Tax=Panicum virgatum TaxID=38727 RepID=A0A8T0XP41_PANVG|nr:hypothetical protein PVAP13_1KG384605 [Panicum virgatum]
MVLSGPGPIRTLMRPGRRPNPVTQEPPNQARNQQIHSSSRIFPIPYHSPTRRCARARRRRRRRRASAANRLEHGDSHDTVAAASRRSLPGVQVRQHSSPLFR